MRIKLILETLHCLRSMEKGTVLRRGEKDRKINEGEVGCESAVFTHSSFFFLGQ